MELGHENYKRKLTKDNVFEILSAIQKPNYRLELAKKFNVTIACIKKVRYGGNYKKWYKEFKHNQTLKEAGLAIYE